MFWFEIILGSTKCSILVVVLLILTSGKVHIPRALACSAELTSSDWSLTQLICSAIWVVPFKTVRIFDENTNQKVTMSKHNVRCVGILGKFWLTISWPLILGWPPPYPLFGIGFWSNKKATFMLFWQHSDFEFYFHLVWVRDFFLIDDKTRSGLSFRGLFKLEIFLVSNLLSASKSWRVTS